MTCSGKAVVSNDPIYKAQIARSQSIKVRNDQCKHSATGLTYLFTNKKGHSFRINNRQESRINRLLRRTHVQVTFFFNFLKCSIAKKNSS